MSAVNRLLERRDRINTMFSPDGVPLRATCMVKLKEANVVSGIKPTKKKEKKEEAK